MEVNSVIPAIPADVASSSTETASTNSPSGSSTADGLANPNLFITLLTAQLQAQDPLDPMNPDDMVNQLTEVSSLQQLISINQTLQNLSTGIVGASPSQTNPTGSSQQ